MKKLITLVCLLVVATCLSSQESIQSVLIQGNNFEKMCHSADAYFEKKHPHLSAKQMAQGEHRDGEFVKYMRWKSYWEHSLNADGTLGNFADPQRNLSRSVNNDLYEGVEWSNISNTEFITLQISMGRTSSMAFHPTDSNIFYVGASIGGIWKTEDGGQTYTPLGDELPYLAVSSIVVDQENPDVLYISLGSHLWNGLPSIGVYKSTDAGLTWQPTSLVFSTAQNTRIYWLAADPTDSSTMLAATHRGLYKTTDGFETITRINAQTCVQAHYKPRDPNVVYLSTDDGQFLKSTDGAESFTLIEDFGQRTVRVALTAQEPDKVVVTHASTMYVSRDAGDSFPESHTLPETFTTQIASINPQDPEDYIAGYFELYRSTEGGANFNKIFDWLGRDGLPVVHVDMRNTYVNPLQNDRIYYCHDGGLDAYNVETGEFIPLSDGLIITQFYDIGVSQSNDQVVSGGSQDNGSMYRNSAGVWDDLAGTGDGMVTEIDPTDERTIYWEFQFGGMRRFDGLNNTGIAPPGENGEGAWITPYQLDPSNPNRLVVGFGHVYESWDQGNTWTRISGELAGGSNLNHIAIAESNGERIYAVQNNRLFVKDTDSDDWVSRALPSGSVTDFEVDPTDMDKIIMTVGDYVSGSKVYTSADAGVTWSNISGALPNVRFGAVEYYKDIENAVFIGSDAGVYYRDDSSPQWILYGQLPHTRVNDIEIQYSSQKIRIGTYGRGVFEADIAIQACDANSLDQDNDGICDIFDVCPLLDDNLIGTSCDDGDPLSSNELYMSNCLCAGGEANLVYCGAAGSPGTGSDFITQVQINDLDNVSGKTEFSDFRELSTELYEGRTYTVSMSLAFSFDLDTSYVWIDYDRSGSFETDELITMSAFVDHTSTGTFTVPALDAYGATTMRVRNIFSNNPTADPCGVYAGEVEDYTIYLRDPSALLVDLDQDGFLSDVDCDDSNPEVNPDQEEEIYNGIDDDCDPATLDDDLDQDGFLSGVDCDDNNADINPAAEEIANNGIDENCDGIDLITSIHELANVEINIYPNPASKIIYIDVDGQLQMTMKLYDISGRLMGTYKDTREINVSTLPMGTYLLEIQDRTTNQKIVERIVVEH